jgi:hypothetical protein
MSNDCGVSDGFIIRRHVRRFSTPRSALYCMSLVARGRGRLVLVHRLLRNNTRKHGPYPGRSKGDVTVVIINPSRAWGRWLLVRNFVASHGVTVLTGRTLDSAVMTTRAEMYN